MRCGVAAAGDAALGRNDHGRSRPHDAETGPQARQPQAWSGASRRPLSGASGDRVGRAADDHRGDAQSHLRSADSDRRPGRRRTRSTPFATCCSSWSACWRSRPRSASISCRGSASAPWPTCASRCRPTCCGWSRAGSRRTGRRKSPSRLTADTAQIEMAVGTTVSVALRNMLTGIGGLWSAVHASARVGRHAGHRHSPSSSCRSCCSAAESAPRRGRARIVSPISARWRSRCWRR